jgi:alkanesulfonate monooxygenase SsuD/methylene tetrahydromethanopterin reductase-like flavin-dependent oxidoreductase (luciferase family)
MCISARPYSVRAVADSPRWGLTLPFAGVPLAQTEPLVRRAEAAGWDDLWTGDTSGPDGFTPLALAAAWTERMRLGTGVVSAFTRGPAVLAQHAAALADASGGRFVLGLGSSSDVIVERWNRVPFTKPLTRVRETVAALRPVLAGERGPGGFKLETPPAEPGLGLARFLFAGYATVPVYEAFFRSLGWGAALDPMVEAWRGGDRKAAVALAPEELLREIFVFDMPDAMRERLGAFASAGITTLCVMPICDPEQLPDLIDAFAHD